MHRSTGKDAVNKNTKPIQFIPRERDERIMTFKCSPEFHEKVKEYAKESDIKVSQLCRIALAEMMRG